MKIKLEMKNYNIILIERLQKSGKIDKYEYLTGEEILSSDQQQVIQQGKFTYLPLQKAFEKQAKMIQDQEKNQISAMKESGKQTVESNEVAKIILILTELVCHMKNKNKYLIGL